MVVFIRRYIFQLLALVAAWVWIAVFQIPDSNLHIIACDVGQGDAILMVKGSVQILTDGGPGSRVLDCLSRHIPFWDRRIELVVSTHPDADHSSGLVDVIKRYNVDTLLANDLNTGTQVVKALEKEVGSRGINITTPREGMAIRLGMIYLDILHPPEGYESTKTNQYSIVYLLKYGSFKALMTGDIEDDVSDLIAQSSHIVPADYIKIPHHGSKNGLSEQLLAAVMPKIAVISVGKNSYGHPHEEVLKMLEENNVNILRTDLIGDVEVITDGEKYWVRD